MMHMYYVLIFIIIYLFNITVVCQQAPLYNPYCYHDVAYAYHVHLDSVPYIVHSRYNLLFSSSFFLLMRKLSASHYISI